MASVLTGAGIGSGLVKIAQFVVRPSFRVRRLGGGSAITGGIKITASANVSRETATISRVQRQHERLIVMALNKALRSARTQTVRKLSTQLGVTQKPLRKRVQAIKATRHKKPLRGSLWVGTKRPIQAAELAGTIGASKTGHVKIGKRVYRGAFRARMPGGHEGVFIRKPNATHRRRPDGQMTQLPIEEGVVRLMPEAESISRREAMRAHKEIFPKELRRLGKTKLTPRGGF